MALSQSVPSELRDAHRAWQDSPPVRCAWPARYPLDDPAQGHPPAMCAWPARSPAGTTRCGLARAIHRAQTDGLTLGPATTGPAIGDN